MTGCFGIQKHGGHLRCHLGHHPKIAIRLKSNRCFRHSENHLQLAAEPLVSPCLLLQGARHRQTDQNQPHVHITSSGRLKNRIHCGVLTVILLYACLDPAETPPSRCGTNAKPELYLHERPLTSQLAQLGFCSSPTMANCQF